MTLSERFSPGLNLDLMAHPINWAIVLLSATLFFLAAHVVVGGWTQMKDNSSTPPQAPGASFVG